MTKEETFAYIKAYLDGDTQVGNIIPLRSVLESAIKYLSEPFLPSNLDEAAKKIAYGVCKQLPNGTEKDSIVYYAILAAKAGAEWMAGQGVSADSEVCKLADRVWVTPIDEKKFMQDVFDNFVSGDKVVVQIRKK